MAAVAFAFGSAHPGLSEHEALELARLLELTRTLAGISASGKIKEQAARWKDRLEVSQDVELSEDELDVLSRVLSEEPWPQQQPWFTHLRDEVERARLSR